MASPALTFSLLFSALLFTTSWALGINYGQIANNLPHPESVVPLAKSMGITRIKLYDADPHVLKAFANTGVEFVVGLGNEYLSDVTDPKQALSWVKSNVQCYLPATKISYIAVGNEVLTSNDSSALSAHLLPAMENIHTALVALNLHRQVAVTTPHSLAVLDVSYPPSAAVFRRDISKKLFCILDFHCKVGSPFLINAYPYFAYKADPKRVPLDFVLFEGSGIVDSGSGLHYDNMFYAQIDAVNSAVEKMGYGGKVRLQISETGWPSKGDADEAGASPENACKYNGNLLKLLNRNKGTPMRPEMNFNVYVFALFNENKKPGPTSERNFGLLKPDGTPVYNLGFNLTALGSGGPSGGGGGGSSDGTMPSVSLPGGSPPNGYLSFDDGERLEVGVLSILCMIIIALQI
ncbi:glucan endo-1,3-beta-glucosidase 11-like [Salvia divinorum]|uniref:glucan endo-1,3-beta-D-glucosidase n=1 Tax=Salvia divinorum TaxID=28513 RepID=A0ABD1GV83_SALDI